jgi:hypothetical protein
MLINQTINKGLISVDNFEVIDLNSSVKNAVMFSKEAGALL